MLLRICFIFVLAASNMALEPLSAREARCRSAKDNFIHFQAGLDKIIAQYGANSHVGVEIISQRRGLRLYQKNANHLFIPASSLKMFTAAAALSTLGPDYALTTELLTDGYVEGSILHGNLFLKGGGNPELATKDLEEMVQSLSHQGITKVTGAVYVDHSDFDGISQGPGWMWDDEPEYWNSPMDALTVNHSCLKILVSPATSCKAPGKVITMPDTSFVSVRNDCLTTEDGDSGIFISRSTSGFGNVIKVEGAIKKDSKPLQAHVSLSQPHLYAGHVFLDILKKNKMVAEQNSLEAKRAPSDSLLLVEHSSRPISLILQKMMKESDNLYADCLFKKIGQKRYGTRGSWSSGSRAVREFLFSFAHLDTSEMVVLDGSGLSRYNLVSPHQFAQFLYNMSASPYYADFVSSLPLSGVDGTLKTSLREPELKAKIRAKSGGMRGVKTLCGFVTTKDGEPLIFSIMINGFVEPRSKEHRLENEICRYMVNYENDRTL